MEKTDYIFGMNYIDQLQEGHALQRCSTVEQLLSCKPFKPINNAFIWSNTPQGQGVWAKRERIFDLYYSLKLMNTGDLPRFAVSLEDEPLLMGVDRPLPY